VAADRGDELIHRRKDLVARHHPGIAVDSGKLEPKIGSCSVGSNRHRRANPAAGS
jgi:hypothetical protein